MSLESQIAALVSAANRLTSQVAGKMSQIDQKVSDAAKVVPYTIRTEFEKVYYVDEVNGDYQNSGTQEAPLSCIGDALSQSPRGAFIRIEMLSDVTRIHRWHDMSPDSRNYVYITNDIRLRLNGHAMVIKTSRKGTDGGSTERLHANLNFRLEPFKFMHVEQGVIRLEHTSAEHQAYTASDYPTSALFVLTESKVRLTNIELNTEIANMLLAGLDGWTASRAYLSLNNSTLRGAGKLRAVKNGGLDIGAISVSLQDVINEGWTGMPGETNA